MAAVEHEWLRLGAPRPPRARVFRGLTAVAVLVFVADFGATAAGATQGILSTAFAAIMAPVPFVVWWAYRRAPTELRRPVCLLAVAATLWLFGSLIWEGFYVADGRTIPQPPGVWDAFFVSAQLLVIIALLIALRLFISVRMAALDALVVVATGVVLAAPFVWHGLSRGATVASVFTLNRPVLSIVILMLVVSAALGSSEGLPLSMAMLGLAEVGLTVGNLVYAYAAVQDAYVSVRWADLAWQGGALTAMLAASVLILQVDRPVQFSTRRRIPEHPAGSRAVLLLSVLALALSLVVAAYGQVAGSRSLTLVGLGAALAIGLAMASRGREAIRTAEGAYERLDESLAETERAHDQLAIANEELRRANIQIRTIHVAYADLLNLADERTNGRIRELIEETGDELVDLLEDLEPNP
ncbi:MAG: hypothetical protein ACRDLR_03690 [Gaiellaceae bacterium]